MMEQKNETRIDRIEGSIVKLERDLALMASSITNLSGSVGEMSGSVKELVKMYTDQEVMKTDFQHKHSKTEDNVAHLWCSVKDLSEDIRLTNKTMNDTWDELSKRVDILDEHTYRNTFFAKNAGRLIWIAVTALFTITSSVLTYKLTVGG